MLIQDEKNNVYAISLKKNLDMSNMDVVHDDGEVVFFNFLECEYMYSKKSGTCRLVNYPKELGILYAGFSYLYSIKNTLEGERYAH